MSNFVYFMHLYFMVLVVLPIKGSDDYALLTGVTLPIKKSDKIHLQSLISNINSYLLEVREINFGRPSSYTIHDINCKIIKIKRDMLLVSTTFSVFKDVEFNLKSVDVISIKSWQEENGSPRLAEFKAQLAAFNDPLEQVRERAKTILNEIAALELDQSLQPIEFMSQTQQGQGRLNDQFSERVDRIIDENDDFGKMLEAVIDEINNSLSDCNDNSDLVQEPFDNPTEHEQERILNDTFGEIGLDKKTMNVNDGLEEEEKSALNWATLELIWKTIIAKAVLEKTAAINKAQPWYRRIFAAPRELWRPIKANWKLLAAGCFVLFSILVVSKQYTRPTKS